MCSKKELEKIYNKLERIEELILRPPTDEKHIERIINTVKDKNEVSVDELERMLGFSKPHTLKLMRRAGDECKEAIFIKGNPYNPSKLQIVNSDNKLDYVPILLIKEFRGEIGATKTFNSIMNQYDLNKVQCQDIVSQIVKYTRNKITVIKGKTFGSRRLKNKRLR